MWAAVLAAAAGAGPAEAGKSTTVPVPPLYRRPPGLAGLQAAAAAAAAQAASAEKEAMAAEAAAAAAAARAARDGTAGAGGGGGATTAAPPPRAPPPPSPPPPAARPASASAATIPLHPADADAAARAGARLRVKWTDGEFWDATVRPPPPGAGLSAGHGPARCVTLVYDTGEEEEGVDLADLAGKGEIEWTAGMRGWALAKVAQAPAPPPRPPPPPPPPPQPAAAPAAAARVPISALVRLGPAVAGTRLRVLLAGGAALEVTAGPGVLPSAPGLPVLLPDGRTVELLTDRDGVDFAVYVAGA